MDEFGFGVGGENHNILLKGGMMDKGRHPGSSPSSSDPSFYDDTPICSPKTTRLVPQCGRDSQDEQR
jgi:hypothetical protein